MMMMMVKVDDYDRFLVMKFIIVKEVISCDILPVVMFSFHLWLIVIITVTKLGHQNGDDQ